MDTTRSQPSVPATTGASGRHHEPGSGLASTCPAQPPSKSRDASPWYAREARRWPHQGPGAKEPRPTRGTHTTKKSVQRASMMGAWQNHSGHTKAQHAGAHHTTSHRRTYKTQGAKDTADAAHQARRPVQESQLPKDTANRTHHARSIVNRCQGAKDTPHTTHKAPTLVNKRQVAADTKHTTHQAQAPVNKRQVAEVTAHTTHQAHKSGSSDKWPSTLHTPNTGHARQ